MRRPRSFTLLPHSVPRWLTDPIVGVIARTGATPNHISVLGFVGNLGAATLAARGDFLAAGLVMLAASALDLLDGALARATGRVSAFGAVLDAALDRLSEAAVLAGLAFYFAQRNDREEVILCFAALTGSVLVSYIRAHAMARGLDLRESPSGSWPSWPLPQPCRGCMSPGTGSARRSRRRPSRNQHTRRSSRDPSSRARLHPRTVRP
jgi:CDP-diacylglycerol--glycerol-3-phosphate 3-phosphatidyltransferase